MSRKTLEPRLGSLVWDLLRLVIHGPNMKVDLLDDVVDFLIGVLPDGVFSHHRNDGGRDDNARVLY